jgi:hypothetical protein
MEILWDGVGAVQVYDRLTGIPVEVSDKKGFSKITMISVLLTLVVVATVTQILVLCERKKITSISWDQVNNKY